MDNYWNMKPNKIKALLIAQKQLSELVYDAVNLEGIPFTLPEIQTLLDGITVGGHKISDQQVAIQQANTWKKIFELVRTNSFTVSIQTACNLHEIAAKEEALTTWGKFRTGDVYISGTNYSPPKHTNLEKLFLEMIESLGFIEDTYNQAIHIFLTMARNQFFYDVNKRMGRFMMNGYLLSHGYPAINLPAKRQLEFNTNMLQFYGSGDETEMNLFLRSCLQEKIISIMKEDS